ncbi:DUF3152 domain-containing protein [Streptomyces griseorubiginosus]|uniref:DUF3152 domain-containing protein n=1 Tax=Streptomyces griseorubiginosus TaxID=67304 RepID=UPI00076C7073|nr:DUF3152 domain-containing protein [Streptomyces griseorubiginosus]KUM74272.1 hypothetical protein AQI84_21315 [Streptomyces griseorubiginosus]
MQGRLTGGLAALAVFAAVGGAVVAWLPSDAKRPPTATASAGTPVTPSPTATASSGSRVTNSPTPSGTPAPPRTGEPPGQNKSSPSTTPLPESGPGTFVTAPGQSGKVGRGTPLRYRVEVEKGIAISPADVAAQVERTLADPRGWTADGHSAFQRVSSGPTDFRVRLATPGTVDAICAEGGLDTGGKVNCSVHDDVMVNLRRWVLATEFYTDDVVGYRSLIINHEVGHFLGHGHVTCPGEGRPAPAMMQQIKGLHGCVPNVWPYDRDGRLITGPTAP